MSIVSTGVARRWSCKSESCRSFDDGDPAVEGDRQRRVTAGAGRSICRGQCRRRQRSGIDGELDHRTRARAGDVGGDQFVISEIRSLRIRNRQRAAGLRRDGHIVLFRRRCRWFGPRRGAVVAATGGLGQQNFGGKNKTCRRRELARGAWCQIRFANHRTGSRRCKSRGKNQTFPT